MHRSSFEKMQAFRNAYLQTYAGQPLTILDVGSAAVSPDAGCYRPLFAQKPWCYVGLDMAAAPNVDIVPHDPYRWTEITDASVDVVISGQAFEHIEWPWLTISEIARVLRGNGLAVIIAPSAGPVHRFPTDCWRYYPDGLPALASYAGLSVVEQHWDNGYAFPENAFWGEAVIVLQRPYSASLDTSIIEPAASKHAIATHTAQALAALSRFEVRRTLLTETLRRAWFVLRTPLDRLTRL